MFSTALGAMGWVKDGQRRRGNRFIASELGRSDYARIAQAMGCVGIRVETLAKELKNVPWSLRQCAQRDKKVVA